MENYTPNSNKYKNEQKALADKKIEGVVSGTARPKKKSEMQKLASIFLAEDISNVKSYILMDVLVPAVKDAIEDVIHMLLRGETFRSRKGTTASKVSYRNFYERERDRRDYSAPASRSGFDYNEIEFETRADAEAVLDALNEIIDRYGSVSVADLYDLAKVPTTNYTANNYGWTNIFGCKAERIRSGGYILKLPRPMPLK